MDIPYNGQASFAPVFGFGHGQGGSMQYQGAHYPVHSEYGLQYMYPFQQARHQLIAERNAMNEGKTESKPRLSKEEVEKLEKIFQDNPKPSSSVKAHLADELGLERPRINNWFQNRRAKAKQEKRQEEYEARRAENGTSEPASPADDKSTSASETFGDHTHQAMQPSSAMFPDFSARSQASDIAHDGDFEDDSPVASDGFDSPYYAQAGSHQDGTSDSFQSPLSLEFSPGDVAGFANVQAKQNFAHQQSMNDYTSPFSVATPTLAEGVPSPIQANVKVEPMSEQYQNMASTGFPDSTTASFFQEHAVSDSQSAHEIDFLTENITEGSVHSHIDAQEDAALIADIDGGDDSFRSPPPPADIASRRNMRRPATLQAASLRSRSYNLGSGPKTALEGPRRMDPSSPASTIRRIASSNGSLTGRIHKSGMAPRSPMFFARNSEAFLQYQSRAPMGPATASFPGTTPPTPMTPAVLSQQGVREPTVSSTSSDDEALMLGSAFPSNVMQEVKIGSNLKTPPDTPALITSLAANAQNYVSSAFGCGLDYATDQPLLTPYLQTDFPDLGLRHVPSYVDISDNSLPSTPLYPHMMGSMQDQGAFGPGGNGNTQYDWDANESVTSMSSPGQSRSKHIQFTQNMTPEDYTAQPER